MKVKLSAKAIFSIVLGCLIAHYFFWIHYVGAFPSENGQYNFYSPMGSYLFLNEALPDHGTLMTLFPEKFPHGIGIFLYLIWKLGLSPLFLWNPWIVFLPVLLLIGGISWMVNPALKNKLVCLIALYFFPISQITLKSFSIHCIIIYLFLFAILILHSKKIHNVLVKHILFGLFVFICMSLKHLGIILAFCYGIVFYLSYQEERPPKLFTVYLSFLFCLALPFYLNSNSGSYTFGELALHNSVLSTNLIVLLPFAFIYIAIFITLLTKSQRSTSIYKNGYPILFDSPISLVIFILLLLPFLIILDLKVFFFYGMFLSIALFSLGLSLLFTHDSTGDEAIFSSLFFASFSCAAFLYGTRFAITGDVFFFSFVLVTFLFFKQSQSYKLKSGVALSFFLMSAFMPDHSNLNNIFGLPATSFYQYYVDGFHQNPLSWQKSKILKDRKVIQDLLKTKDLKKHVEYCFSGFVNMHPFQFQVLETLGEEKIINPHINTLINKIENGTSNAFIDYREQSEELFSHWLKEGLFLYFVYSDKTIQSDIYDLSKEKLCKTFLNDIDIDEWKKNYPLRIEVSIALQNMYYFWLKRTKQLDKHYQRFALDQASFYILKNITQKGDRVYQPFTQLIDFYNEKLELQNMLQEKGQDYFDEMLAKAKSSALNRCHESKVLCQAIQESIILFSTDRTAKNRAVLTLKKMDKDWEISSTSLQKEYLKFNELLPKVLANDVRLADAMMSIAQRKFRENLALESLQSKLNHELEEDNILRKTEDLWLEGNRYLDMNPPNFKKALPFLKKALILDPSSERIKKDYELVIRNLN